MTAAADQIAEDAMRGLARPRTRKRGSRFTSDLSVNEFLPVCEAGFRPLGMVLGSSVYHVGVQLGRWSENQELEVLSTAMSRARELAMARMRKDARGLGADGVVGVRLDIEFREFGENVAEFTAVGTAVKGDQPRRWRTHTGNPFTSYLSGQDFFTLVKAGYAPVGMVMGSCVYHVAHQRFRQDWAPWGGTRRSHSSPTPCTTPVSWRSAGCRRRPRRCGPRASSACGSCRCRTGGVGTPRSSS